MNEEVRKRVDEYCEKQEAILKEERNKDLIRRGLYDVVDEIKVPLDITDEEYERIKKYKTPSSDGYLLVIGIVVIIIGGILVGYTAYDVSCLFIMIITICISVHFFALYKIINLLNDKK